MGAVNGEITKGFSFPKQHVGSTSAPMRSGLAVGTIRAGDVVADNASTGIIVAGAAAVDTLLGIAAEAAVSGEQVTYFMAMPGVVFEATLEKQDAQGYVAALTDTWIKYGLHVDPAGSAYHYMNQNDTSTTCAVLMEWIDPIGTVRPRGRFMFVASAFIGQ